MPESKTIKPTDPLLFLIGNKAAIQRLAGTSWTILIGAILIITAGIARNYDHLYILGEGEWLYGPFVASLATSLIIFVISFMPFLLRPGSKHPYLTFLSLYWMTAPCAWLYAIPVESHTDILTATKWNVTFLAIVSIWRVTLMIRSIQVLTGESLLKSTCRILFPASVIMMIASAVKGTNIVGIMGGVRLSPDEQFLYDATTVTTSLSFWAALITLSLAIILLFGKKQVPPPELPWKTIPKPTRTLTYAALTLIPWFAVAAIYFIPTKNNYRVKTLIEQRKYEKANDLMATLSRDKFLKAHNFPPATKGGYNVTQLLQNLKPTHPEWLKKELINSLKISDPRQHYGQTASDIKMNLTVASDSFTPTDFTKELWQEIKTTHNLPDPPIEDEEN